MRRVRATPRLHWQSKVEAAGLTWHSGDSVYWNEAAFYELTAQDVERLESATNELARMALHAVQHVIDHKLYARFAIPEHAINFIEDAWEAEPPSLYGRFDLAYDGSGEPKMLEYNADTPTSLLEAAVVQWYWLQDMFPKCDQFNSIHERLIERWGDLKDSLPGGHVNFCSVDDAEDGTTVAYLDDTARQAGLTAALFPIDEIGWNGAEFVGPDERALGAVFKLYPWEWMVREEFGDYLGRDRTLWIEPAWKMLLSNKAILPVLWELYPGHPNLLEAHFDGPSEMAEWVRKPLLGREGANVTLHGSGAEVRTGGEYGEEGFVFQKAAALKRMDGMHAVVGSWVVGSWVVGHEARSACGVGVRESESPIITNLSRFVPHVLG